MFLLLTQAEAKSVYTTKGGYYYRYYRSVIVGTTSGVQSKYNETIVSPF